MSYNSYYKQIRDANKKQEAADIAASDALYDAKINAVSEGYGQKIKDTAENYETALKRNEVQKLINERAVARRSAELGLTDSGLNRTGQLAVQLSYANNKGNIEMQRQKTVDTLAATMRAQMTELQTSKIAAANKITSSYGAKADKRATEMYKADVDAANKRVKNNEAARNTVKTDLLRSGLSNEQKKQIITNYIDTYLVGASDDDVQREMKHFAAIANIPYELLVPDTTAQSWLDTITFDHEKFWGLDTLKKEGN
jgi:hypothetical protein